MRMNSKFPSCQYDIAQAWTVKESFKTMQQDSIGVCWLSSFCRQYWSSGVTLHIHEVCVARHYCIPMLCICEHPQSKRYSKQIPLLDVGLAPMPSFFWSRVLQLQDMCECLHAHCHDLLIYLHITSLHVTSLHIIHMGAKNGKPF